MFVVNKVLDKWKFLIINCKIVKNFNFVYKFVCGDNKFGEMVYVKVSNKFKVGVDICFEMDKLFLVQKKIFDYLKSVWVNIVIVVYN